jgi:hypothetical protein
MLHGNSKLLLFANSLHVACGLNAQSPAQQVACRPNRDIIGNHEKTRRARGSSPVAHSDVLVATSAGRLPLAPVAQFIHDRHEQALKLTVAGLMHE